MLFLLREFVQNRFFTFFNDDPMARLLLTLLLPTLLMLPLVRNESRRRRGNSDIQLFNRAQGG